MSLVSTEWLQKNLNNVKIIDSSWHLPKTKRNGYKEYLKNHIKNSLFFDTAVTAIKRRSEKIGHVIKPCYAYHLIAVNKKGEFKKLSYYSGENWTQSLKLILITNTMLWRIRMLMTFKLDTETYTFIALASSSGYKFSFLETFFLCEVNVENLDFFSSKNGLCNFS